MLNLGHQNYIQHWRSIYLSFAGITAASAMLSQVPVPLIGLLFKFLYFPCFYLLGVNALIFAIVSEVLNVIFRIQSLHDHRVWSARTIVIGSAIFFLLFNSFSPMLPVCIFYMVVSVAWYIARAARPRKAPDKPPPPAKGSSERLLYKADSDLKIKSLTDKLEEHLRSGNIYALVKECQISYRLCDENGAAWSGANSQSHSSTTAVLSLYMEHLSGKKDPQQKPSPDKIRILELRLSPKKNPDSGTLLEMKWRSCTIKSLSDPKSFEYQLAHYLVDSFDNKLQKEALINYSVKAELQAVNSHAETKQGRTAWPNPNDFCEAIQNPKTSLSDPSLKGSQVQLNMLGYPRVASGMFASVFEMRDGEKRWALRCFNHDPKEKADRYTLISKSILSDKLSYTVDFDYQKNGILVNSAWYPVLKMDWVEGETLDLFVQKNLFDKNKLANLQEKFRLMLRSLQENGIAHGDLQHGNILVRSQEIYLVDYDAFFVPGLEGKESKEIGHANYQHPARSASDFGPYLDNFSSLVIDLSLSALIEEPELWDEFDGGDECLLFRRKDFLEGKDSALFQRLLNHKADHLRKGASHLLAYLSLSINEIPGLIESKELADSSMPETERIALEKAEKSQRQLNL